MKCALLIPVLVVLVFGSVFAEEECASEETDGIEISWGVDDEADNEKQDRRSNRGQVDFEENTGFDLKVVVMGRAISAELEYESGWFGQSEYYEDFEYFGAAYGIHVNRWVTRRFAIGSGFRYGRNRSADLSTDFLTIPIEIVYALNNEIGLSLGVGIEYYKVDYTLDEFNPVPFGGYYYEEYDDWVGPAGSVELGVLISKFSFIFGLAPPDLNMHDHDIDFSGFSFGVGVTL